MNRVEKFKLLNRAEVVPSNGNCVGDSPHTELDRGRISQRTIRQAIIGCNGCIYKLDCAPQAKELTAMVGALQSVAGGIEVTLGIGELLEARRQEPVLRFQKNIKPERKEDAPAYTRVMYRSGLEEFPELTHDHQGRLDTLRDTLAARFTESSAEDRERVLVTTARILVTESEFPDAHILFTTETILQDARKLHGAGGEYDSIELALRRSPNFYDIEDEQETGYLIEQRRDGAAVNGKNGFSGESVERLIVGAGDITLAECGDTEKAEILLPNELRSARYFVKWTHAQEKRIFHHMLAGHDFVDLITDKAFLRDIKEDERANWFRIFQYSKNFADIIVACNYGFLVTTTKSMKRQTLARDVKFKEMLDEGEIALRDAIDDFDPEYESHRGKGRGKFMSYAGTKVRRAMQKEICRQLGISINNFNNINSALHRAYGFESELKEKPSFEDLREQLVFNTDPPMPVATIDYVISYLQHRSPRPMIDDTIAAATSEEDPEMENLYESLGQLTYKERAVVVYSFGLDRRVGVLDAAQIVERLRNAGIVTTKSAVPDILTQGITNLQTASELAPSRRERPKPVSNHRVRRDDSEQEAIDFIVKGEFPIRKKIEILLHMDLSNQDIAEELGVTVKQVTIHLAGLWTQRTVEVSRLYWDGVARSDIARTLSISSYIVDDILRRQNISDNIILRPEDTDLQPSRNVERVKKWLIDNPPTNMFIPRKNKDEQA